MRISSVIMVLIILLILFGFISHYALNSYSTILELKKTIRDLIQENDGLSLELTKASGRIVVLENTLRNQQNTVIMLQEKEKERNLENLSLTQKLGICQSSQKNSPLLISLMGENNTSPIIFQKRISSILVPVVVIVLCIAATILNPNRLSKLRIHIKDQKTHFLGTNGLEPSSKGTYLFLSPQEMSWLIQIRRNRRKNAYTRVEFADSNLNPDIKQGL